MLEGQSHRCERYVDLRFWSESGRLQYGQKRTNFSGKIFDIRFIIRNRMFVQRRRPLGQTPTEDDAGPTAIHAVPQLE